MMLRLLTLVLISIVSFSSCKRTCENVKVGTTELAESTKQFLQYKDGDVLSFASDSGEEIVFNVSRMSSVYFICQKITCDPLDPYKSSYCEYIEAPLESIFLNSDSTLIAIEASVYAYEPETDLLYDAVRFTLSHQNFSAYASQITDVKFTSPTLEKSKINDIDDFMEERGEVTIHEVKYRDVLLCEDENLTLYYSPTDGIFAFIIRGVIYTRKA